MDLDVSVLRLAVAVGCLIGAENETAAGALLSRVPDLDSAERRGRVARCCMTCIPPWMKMTSRSGSGSARCGPTGSPSNSSPVSWLSAGI